MVSRQRCASYNGALQGIRAGIFQNDIFNDVKTDYKNKLKMGKSDEIALQEILSENSEFLDDDEDKFDFWSDLDRLTEKVRNITVGLIDRGGDVFRFEDDKSELKKRNLRSCAISLSASSRSAKEFLLQKHFCVLGSRTIYSYTRLIPSALKISRISINLSCCLSM